MIASAEPCTSALMTSGSSRYFLSCSLAIMSAMLVAPAPTGCIDFSRFWRMRYSVSSRARASFSTTAKVSPGEGTPSRPRISTGVAGPASVSCSPRSFSRARTRPNWLPATTMSPRFSVPRLTSTVETAPRPLSSLASITTPSAVRSGLAFRSRTSACSRMRSISSSRPCAGLGRDFDDLGVATQALDHDLVLQQLVDHAGRIRARLVHLVDGHDDRHFRGAWRV
jgi:hypothetical protein